MENSHGPSASFQFLVDAIKGQGLYDRSFGFVLISKVKEGREKDFIQAGQTVIPLIRKEKGCLLYDIQQTVDDPRKFIVTEKWENGAALESHLKESFYHEFIISTTDMTEGPPDFQLCTSIL